MNDIVVSRIKDKYKPKTLDEEKQALREIIQEIVLLGLWRSKFFEHASFYGGSALRIFYGVDRFSEDLDFTLKSDKKTFNLKSYFNAIKLELDAFGFNTTIESKVKLSNTAIESAFVKANTSLHLLSIQSSHKTHKDEILRVKFEVDVEPALGFNTDVKQMLWPQLYSIETCDLPSLYAGKLAAILSRERVKYVKGRDWYDMLWFLSKGIKVNLTYLENKLRQVGIWESDKSLLIEDVRTLIRDKALKTDVKEAKRDIVRFINNPSVVDGWSNETIAEAANSIVSN